MAEDIAPVLLEKVQDAFRFNLRAAGVNKKVFEKRARDGTLRSIHQYTRKVGKALADAFTAEITPDVLPDGTMYYNIATRVMKPPIKEAYNMVSDVADQLQTAQNKKLGVGIKPIRPPIQMDRVDGLVDLVCDGSFADNAHYLYEPIRNIVDHFGDNHLAKNMEFLDNSGVETVVVRIAEATACAWCQEREGSYDGYQDAQDNDAFARHEGCRCELEIHGGGTKGRMATKGHAFVRTS